MKYMENEDVKLELYTIRNAVGYKNYAVFENLSEYLRFNQYPTKEQMGAKIKEICKKAMEGYTFQDEMSKVSFINRHMSLFMAEADNYFAEKRHSERYIMSIDAKRTSKAYFICSHLEYGTGDCLCVCETGFSTKQEVKNCLKYIAKNKTDDLSKMFVVDQNGDRVYDIHPQDYIQDKGMEA